MAPENPTTPVDPPAELYVLKNGEMFGPFHKKQLRKGVEERHFSTEDLVQTEGQDEWRPIGAILEPDPADLRGAVAPDWNCILKWVWLRLRANLGEHSLATGATCLAVGILALALSRWTFVFWLPWFCGATVCAIPLLRRKREVPATLLLVGVVCIPLLFIILGPKTRIRESPNASEPNSDSLIADPQAAAPQPLAQSQPPVFPTAPPERPPAPGVEPEAVPPAAAPQPADSQSAPNASAPVPITPHYASATPAEAPPVVPPPNPAVENANPAPPAPEPAPPVDFAHEHGDALVIVKGNEGSGSGFICSAGDSALLFTNTHVIADLTNATVTRMDGAAVIPGAAVVAAGRDIARFDLPKAPGHPLEVISDFNNNVRIGDAVVVLGNSGGGGVITKIDGKIVGIGPDRIEVSAEFIPGNSGSPIIHVNTGQVIGIATYLTKRYDESSGKKDEAPVVRRFGYRIDNVAAWEPVEWNEFRSEAAQIRQISTLTGDIFDFLGSLDSKTAPNFATDTLRRPATEWMAATRTKHLSDFDRHSATRGFLNSLRFMVRNDVTAAESRLRYTYFQDELKNERRVRDQLYKSFDEQSARLSDPSTHPTAVRKSQ